MKRGLVLTLVAGACATISLVIAQLWFFAPLALGIFLYALWYETETVRNALWEGTLFGVIIAGAGICWFWSTLPLNWLHAGGLLLQIAAVFIAWSILSIGMGLSGTLFAVPLWLLRKKAFSSFAPVVASILWMLQSQACMWFFAILMLGRQSLFGPHFSITALGYVLADNHYLLQLAHYGGIVALDATIALMGGVGAVVAHEVIMRRKTHSSTRAVVRASLCNPSVLILFVVLLLPLPFILHPSVFSQEKMLRVTLVTTYIPVETTYEAEDTTAILLAQAAKENPSTDLLAFPEGHGLRTTFPDEAAREAALEKLFPTHEVLIMSSDLASDGNGQVSPELFYDSTTDGTLGTYKKMFLMPIGEYSPYMSELAFSLLGSANFNAYIEKFEGLMQRGTSPESITYHGTTIGGLLCSDIYSPILYRQVEKQSGASVLVSLADPAWFHESHILYDRTVEISKVHAVENDAYFLTADNGAPSYIIDPTGTMIAESPWGITGLLSIEIPANR